MTVKKAGRRKEDGCVIYREGKEQACMQNPGVTVLRMWSPQQAHVRSWGTHGSLGRLVGSVGGG